MSLNQESTNEDYKARIAQLERELLRSKSGSSVFKWVVIGVLGAFGFLIILIVALMFLFTPLLKIEESTGRVEILGGLVDIQAKNVITQLSKEGSFVFGNISGVEILSPQIEAVEIKMGAGELRVDFNSGDEVNWDCDGAGKAVKTQTLEKDSKLSIDFSTALVDCDISLPQKNLKILGQSGEIQVNGPQKALNIRLERGTVSFVPAAGVAYKYYLKATEVPSSEDVLSSQDKNAVPITIEVLDGEISKLDQ